MKIEIRSKNEEGMQENMAIGALHEQEKLANRLEEGHGGDSEG